MATVNLGVIKPVFKGAYNNSTAYVLDNIVTSGGSSYICILASTGNAVSNATYWSQMSAIGTNPQLSMTWDNATADADNGAGKIAWNHATIASATILYVDDVDDAAASIATYVQSWDDVANATAKGIVTITKEGAPAVFATFKVTGSITDASGYSKIPVTHLVSAGSFSDGDGVAVSFAYSGLDGADGTDVGTVITTAGDVLYRDGSGLQRLAKGTAGQALIMNSGATAPEWGDGGAVLQYQYGVKGSNVSSITSSSNGNTPSSAPINVMTPVFNTGSSTSSIWEATAMVGLNNESGAINYNASMRLFVSYDGGSSWSRWRNPSAPSTEGDYLMYAGGTDEYGHITINVINTLTPNQSNTKICAIGFSYEGDNTRWNIHNGQGFTLSCKQYAT